MKKVHLLIAVFGFAVAAHAQEIEGVGYDAQLQQITARIGNAGSNNYLDVGVGMKFIPADSTTTPGGGSQTAVPPGNNFQGGASAFYLTRIMHYGLVSNYFAVGGVIQKLPQEHDNFTFELFAGMEPEILFGDHLVLSTRFGIDIPAVPDFIIQTAGQAISVTNGVNFKIVW